MGGGFDGSHAGIAVVCGHFCKWRCRNGSMLSIMNKAVSLNPIPEYKEWLSIMEKGN